MGCVDWLTTPARYPSHTPQSTTSVVTEMCTYVLQNGELWDVRLLHCGIWDWSIGNWLHVMRCLYEGYLEWTGSILTIVHMFANALAPIRYRSSTTFVLCKTLQLLICVQNGAKYTHLEQFNQLGRYSRRHRLTRIGIPIINRPSEVYSGDSYNHKTESFFSESRPSVVLET